jgi:hypothetical protein
MKSLILAMALAYVDSASAILPAKEHPQERAPQGKTRAAPTGLDTIGSARMLKDRTIVLSLVYWFPGGGHTTPAEFTYKPGHPKYGEVLRHLGGMKPGESKAVKPWTETIDAPPPDFNAPLSRDLKDVPWPETSSPPNDKTR